MALLLRRTAASSVFLVFVAGDRSSYQAYQVLQLSFSSHLVQRDTEGKGRDRASLQQREGSRVQRRAAEEAIKKTEEDKTAKPRH